MKPTTPGLESPVLFRASPRTIAIALLSLPVLSAAVAACSSAEAVDPVPVSTTTTQPEPTVPDDAGPPPDAAPAKRSMRIRNPLGGPANNLLFDGDFELSTAYGSGQYGWRMFSSSGASEVAMTVETGGLCRTGLTCVKLRKGTLLFGRGTAAPGGKAHVMELHARLAEGVPCSKVSPIAVECDTFDVIKKAAPDQAFAGEPDGWCRYTAAFAAADSAVCMYIQNSLDPDQQAIVDSALLGPADGTIPLKLTPPYTPDADTLSEMAQVRDYLRRTTPFGLPPPAAKPPAD